jgi:hypothetical protein
MVPVDKRIDTLVLKPSILPVISNFIRHLYGDGLYGVIKKDEEGKLIRSLARPLRVSAHGPYLTHFLESLKTSSMLELIEMIISDPRFEEMKTSNWNYYGDYIKHWPNNLMKQLQLCGLEYDTQKSQFKYDGQYVTKFSKAGLFLDLKINDPFYDKLIDEINRSVQFELPNAGLVLSRKLVENLLIDVLRKKYGVRRLSLYYDKRKKRYVDLSVLIINLEKRKKDFRPDEKLLEEALSLSKKLKEVANSSAHSIFSVPDTDYLSKYKIGEIAALLDRLMKSI